MIARLGSQSVSFTYDGSGMPPIERAQTPRIDYSFAIPDHLDYRGLGDAINTQIGQCLSRIGDRCEAELGFNPKEPDASPAPTVSLSAVRDAYAKLQSELSKATPKPKPDVTARPFGKSPRSILV